MLCEADVPVRDDRNGKAVAPKLLQRRSRVGQQLESHCGDEAVNEGGGLQVRPQLVEDDRHATEAEVVEARLIAALERVLAVVGALLREREADRLRVTLDSKRCESSPQLGDRAGGPDGGR